MKAELKNIYSQDDTHTSRQIQTDRKRQSESNRHTDRQTIINTLQSKCKTRKSESESSFIDAKRKYHSTADMRHN